MESAFAAIRRVPCWRFSYVATSFEFSLGVGKTAHADDQWGDFVVGWRTSLCPRAFDRLSPRNIRAKRFVSGELCSRRVGRFASRVGRVYRADVLALEGVMSHRRRIDYG